MIELTASGNNLPLAFQVGKHFAGNLPAFTGEGFRQTGEVLDDRLAEEGVGLKTITVSGLYQPGEGPALRQLIPWTQTTELIGTVDRESIARAVYQVSRDFGAGQKGARKQSPRELYVTHIVITRGREPAPPPAPRAARQEPRIRRVVRYKDRETGEFVSKAKWKRSRAQKKGKAGRYVRVTLLRLR